MFFPGSSWFHFSHPHKDLSSPATMDVIVMLAVSLSFWKNTCFGFEAVPSHVALKQLMSIQLSEKVRGYSKRSPISHAAAY